MPSLGYSRAQGYRWLARFQAEGEAGLGNRSSRPHRSAPGARVRRWAEVLLAQREARGWGPRKLWHWLRQLHPRAKLPSERTVARLLARAGHIVPGRVRSRRGPAVPPPKRQEATRPHEIWTMDFKGHFRTGDGARCDALTVRDLFSRFLLCIRHVPAQSEAAVRRVLRECFRRHGLPRVIRVDNGAPFGGRGALGLSRISVWWVRLGIEVQFSRPAKPQDNGAHEQMHRELKRRTACPPAASLRAQARRFAEFCREYNEERPHAALGGRTPRQEWRQNRRRYREPGPLRYPKGWQTLEVRAGGRALWRGRERVIGRAYAGQCLGLRSKHGTKVAAPEVMEVYLGRLLIGELHAQDPGGMRPARAERTPWPKPLRK